MNYIPTGGVCPAPLEACHGQACPDGAWHAVVLELTHNYTLLALDDSYVERRRADRAPARLWPLAPDSSFFFGARVSPDPGGLGGPWRAREGFRGCLGALTLNGYELPPPGRSSRHARVVGRSGVGPGCLLHPDPCLSQPCLHGALCSSSSLAPGGQWRRFWCSCAAGSTGGRCELQRTACQLQPCRNGAECRPAGDAFTCRCPRGLVGRLCEEDVDECEQEVCENGGVCVNTLGGFSCNCSLGFTGRSCQEVSDEDATQMVGVGVLVFVVAVLLILFAGLRRKISPPRKGAESEGRALGVSTVTSEAGYMLQQAGTDFKAARLSVGSSPGDSGCLGNGGPPQVMVRPNCHSPRRHGDRAGEWAVSSEGSQLSSFLSDASHLRGGAGSRRGVAVCSVAPNLPPASQRHSELSPAHKVPWEAAGGRRGRGREQDWGRRALEAEQTQRGEEAPGVQEESRCFSEASSVSSFTSESFDDDASVVTVVRLVSDAPGDAAESPDLEEEASRPRDPDACVEL
ncbi:hypothetical protein CRUP_000135, partial [Coryphaenoides rupestris]